jgi:hypothetical protein
MPQRLQSLPLIPKTFDHFDGIDMRIEDFQRDETARRPLFGEIHGPVPTLSKMLTIL